MATKVFDSTKSADFNEDAINNKFEELEQSGGGSVERAEDESSDYYSSFDYGMSFNKEGNLIAEARTLFNSVKFNEDLAANRVFTQTAKFAHGSKIAVDSNGIGYCSHIINTEKDHDSPYHVTDGITTKVMLYVHDLTASTPTQLASATVAEHGDTVTINENTYYIVSGTGCPNVFPISGGVRVIFAAGVHQNAGYTDTAERVWYTFYRDFTYSNNTLSGGTIGVCTIGGELMNNANIAAALGRSAFSDQNRTIAMVNQYAKRIENNVDYYYIGGAYSSELASGVIFRTTDFKEFSVWWQIPELPLQQTLKFEFSCYNYHYYSSNYYLAMGFRTNSDKHLIWLVDWGTKETKLSMLVPSCSDGFGGRSCFLPQPPSGAYTLQMIYDTPGYGRASANVLRFDTPNGADSLSVSSVIAQTYYMSYPSVVYYDGNYFVSYTDIVNKHKAVAISKFSPFKYDGKNVIPILSKILETFEPSE